MFGHIIVVASTRVCTWRYDCDRRAMAINGKTKVLRTPPSRCVSAQLLYFWVSTQWWSRWCSQNLCRPFLWAVRFDNLINELHYIARNNFSKQRYGRVVVEPNQTASTSMKIASSNSSLLAVGCIHQRTNVIGRWMPLCERSNGCPAAGGIMSGLVATRLLEFWDAQCVIDSVMRWIPDWCHTS